MSVDDTSGTPARPASTSFALRGIDRRARQALVATTLAWLFEVFDIVAIALSIHGLTHDFGTTKAQVGFMTTAIGFAQLVGGIGGGGLAERYGRVRVLSGSVALYAAASGLSAFAPSLAVVGVLRVVGGLGMGSTWTAGSALVTDTWPAAHRGKAGAISQIGLPLGSMLAITTAAAVTRLHGGLDTGGWRTLFALGALPLLLAAYIRLRVPEPGHTAAAAAGRSAGVVVRGLFTRDMIRPLLQGFGFLVGVSYYYWAVASFLPTYLLEVTGLPPGRSLFYLLWQQLGAVAGFTVFGALTDRWGRKWLFMVLAFVAGLSLILIVVAGQDGRMALLVATFAAGAGISGIFSGVVAWTAELMYRSPVRALAMGTVYNLGRIGGLTAPAIVGSLAVDTAGFKAGLLSAAAAAFVSLAVMATTPETRHRRLLDTIDTHPTANQQPSVPTPLEEQS
ncbi:MFS transporter [Nocardia sp. NPDC101769]|uniref:MFS transporter n=1 Tax=Nocardia sp. NPDC101769 TaxID=3364333 RepID=UPI00380A0248